MTQNDVFVGTWDAGLFVVSGEKTQQELGNHGVRALTADGHGNVLGIVDGRSLCRRTPGGEWYTIATSDVNLACCVVLEDFVYLGTDDARILRVRPGGHIESLNGFASVAGRGRWYAGGAMVDGKFMGPPLGIRSMAATVDGALLANVHVGGIPRSADGGVTWLPTIEIDSDVHEVRTHPTRPNIVAAASAIGLCTSSDGGLTWQVEQRGLHAPHCSAAAFAGDDILVSASVDPFAAKGAIYRRGIDERGPLVRISGGGLPEWLDGKVDTSCIATHGSSVAMVDWKGHLYVSGDYGHTWCCRVEGIRNPGGVLIV